MRGERGINVAWLICVLGAMESVALFVLALVAGPRVLYLVGCGSVGVSAAAGAILARLVYLSRRSSARVEISIESTAVGGRRDSAVTR